MGHGYDPLNPPGPARGERLAEARKTFLRGSEVSPARGARAVVEAIGRARKSVRVQTVALISPPIAQALVEAHQRGVSVKVIVGGKAATGHAAVPSLARSGIAVLSDRAHVPVGGMAVIDRQVVLTGAFSFATGADSGRAENLLVISDSSLAARYAENWKAHAAHSVRPSGQ